MNGLAKEKVINCYFCGNVIEMFSQQVEKKIPMATKGGVRNYRRQFHIDCLPKYLDGLEDKKLLSDENSDWDAVYQYFRKEILGLPPTVPLEAHTTKRLLGLRLGQYFPQGTNTRILPRGYDFKTILVTLKVVKAKIHVYLATTNFANNKHRIDGIMRFVTGEINDVYKRMELQKKSNEKLKQDVATTKTVDYTSHLKRNEEAKKIRNDVDIDTGGLL